MAGQRDSRAIVPYMSSSAESIASSDVTPPSSTSDISSMPGAIVDLSVVSGEGITTGNTPVPKHKARALELDAFPIPPDNAHKVAAKYHHGDNDGLPEMPQSYASTYVSFPCAKGLSSSVDDFSKTPIETFNRLGGLGVAHEEPTGSNTMSETTEVELPVGFDPHFRRPRSVQLLVREIEPPLHFETIQDQYNAPLVDNAREKPGFFRKSKRFYRNVFYGTVVMAIIGAIIGLTMHMTQPKGKSISLGNSGVSIGSINITSPGLDEFMLSLVLNVQKQTNITGGMGEMKCELYGVPDTEKADQLLRGNELAQSFIGNVQTDRLMMAPGKDLEVNAATDTIDPDNSNWGNLVGAIFAGDEQYKLQVQAKGSYTSKDVTWALGFKKLLPVVGSIEKAQGLFPTRYGMGEFYLLPQNDTEALNGTFGTYGSIPYQARTVFTNPSNLTTFMGTATLNLLMDGEIIGSHAIPNLTVVPDDNFVPYLTGNMSTRIFKDSTIFSRFLQATMCWTCLNPGILTCEGIASYIDGVEIPYLTQGMKAVNRSASLIARSDILDEELSQVSTIAIKDAKLNRVSIVEDVILEDGYLLFNVSLPVNLQWFPIQVTGYSMALDFTGDEAGVSIAYLNVSSNAQSTWSVHPYDPEVGGYTEVSFVHRFVKDSVKVVGNNYFLDEAITNAGGRGSSSTLGMTGYLTIDLSTPYANGTLEAMKISRRTVSLEAEWIKRASFTPGSLPGGPPADWPIGEVWEGPIESGPEEKTASTPQMPTAGPSVVYTVSPSMTTIRTPSSSRTILSVSTGYRKPSVTPGLGSVLKVAEEVDIIE